MKKIKTKKETLENYSISIKKFDNTVSEYDFLISGKNNPYNFVGEMHNNCVKYLSQKHKK